MIVLYCTNNVRDFIRYRRDNGWLNQLEFKLQPAGTPSSVLGFDKQSTMYIRGKNYDQLDPHMRVFVEKNYREYLPK